MPSPHRRIGLVLDDDLDRALGVFRDLANPAAPEAGLARRAVFEGALFEAIVKAAMVGSARRARALAVLREVRELLPALGLPQALEAGLLGEIDRVSDDPDLQERRQRQLALLASPDPHGRAARDLVDSFDAFDRLPA